MQFPAIRPSTSAASSPDAGFSMIEVLTGATITTVGILMFARCMLETQNAAAQNREMSTALLAAQSVLEDVRATPFDQVVAKYNDRQADDPDGAGTAPGGTFDVTESGESFQLTATIELPLSDSGLVQETVDAPEMGMPADLNGDGTVSSAAYATGYDYLPVTVRVEWETDRPNAIVLRSVLCE